MNNIFKSCIWDNSNSNNRIISSSNNSSSTNSNIFDRIGAWKRMQVQTQGA